MKTRSIVILISGTGSNLQAIINAVVDKKIDAKISAVISNRPNASGIDKAKTANIKTIVIDHDKYEHRRDYDEALYEQVNTINPDLIVLAGYMRIISDQFINKYHNQILNVHPSLLPAYKGLNTHQQVIDAGEIKHGASAHFVSNELDSGPVIIQAELNVENHDDAFTLSNRVLEQEHIIYPLAIQWFIEGRVALMNNHVNFDNKPISKPAKWLSNTLYLPE